MKKISALLLGLLFCSAALGAEHLRIKVGGDVNHYNQIRIVKKTDYSKFNCEVFSIAEVDGKIIGLAGIGRVGGYEKVARRAEFGVSVDREYWGLGVGRALTRACIACARRAGYAQLELDVVADNERAAALYRSEGFVVYGTNPRGFYSRLTGWQPLTLMRLELDDVSIPESRSTETV